MKKPVICALFGCAALGLTGCVASVPAARAPTEESSAIISVCVDADGKLTKDPEVVLSSGSPRNDNAAIGLAKAQSGHYQPATEHGKPVPGCSNIRFNFNLY